MRRRSCGRRHVTAKEGSEVSQSVVPRCWACDTGTRTYMLRKSTDVDVGGAVWVDGKVPRNGAVTIVYDVHLG